MQNFARIEAGLIAELLVTETSPADLFHPDLDWRSAPPEAQIGWHAADSGFAPPASTPAFSMPAPDLAQLEAELAALSAKFAAFKAG
jgi:hypothetical protein